MSIIGPQRSGKSFLLNNLTNTNVFKTSHLTQPCTIGINFLSTPVLYNEKQTLVLDIEGLYSQNSPDNHILAVAFLMSSFILFNQIGHLSEQTITNINQLMKHQSGELIYVLRDFHLELQKSEDYEQTIKLDQKCFIFERPNADENILQHLDIQQSSKQFQVKLQELKEYINNKIQDKIIDFKKVTLSNIIEMIKNYKSIEINDVYQNFLVQNRNQQFKNYIQQINQIQNSQQEDQQQIIEQLTQEINQLQDNILKDQLVSYLNLKIQQKEQYDKISQEQHLLFIQKAIRSMDLRSEEQYNQIVQLFKEKQLYKEFLDYFPQAVINNFKLEIQNEEDKHLLKLQDQQQQIVQLKMLINKQKQQVQSYRDKFKQQQEDQSAKQNEINNMYLQIQREQKQLELQKQQVLQSQKQNEDTNLNQIQNNLNKSNPVQNINKTGFNVIQQDLTNASNFIQVFEEFSQVQLQIQKYYEIKIEENDQTEVNQLIEKFSQQINNLTEQMHQIQQDKLLLQQYIDQLKIEVVTLQEKQNSDKIKDYQINNFNNIYIEIQSLNDVLKNQVKNQKIQIEQLQNHIKEQEDIVNQHQNENLIQKQTILDHINFKEQFPALYKETIKWILGQENYIQNIINQLNEKEQEMVKTCFDELNIEYQ